MRASYPASSFGGTYTRSFSMSSPDCTRYSKCSIARREHHASVIGVPILLESSSRSRCCMEIVFAISVAPSLKRNFTSTESLWRSEIAVCSHLKRTCQVRPKGSGPASNSLKFSTQKYLNLNMMSKYEKELAFGRDIARRAGELALHHREGGIGHETKSDESPVTIADRECEKLIVSVIAEAFPEDGVLGEE